MVDPTKTQEAQYKALLDAQNAAINALKPGKQMSDAYKAVVSTLQVPFFPQSLSQSHAQSCQYAEKSYHLFLKTKTWNYAWTSSPCALDIHLTVYFAFSQASIASPD